MIYYTYAGSRFPICVSYSPNREAPTRICIICYFLQHCTESLYFACRKMFAKWQIPDDLNSVQESLHSQPKKEHVLRKQKNFQTDLNLRFFAIIAKRDKNKISFYFLRPVNFCERSSAFLSLIFSFFIQTI